MKDPSQVIADALKGTLPADSEAVPPRADPAALALLSETIHRTARNRTWRRRGFALAAAVLAGGLSTWALLRPPADGVEVQSAHGALVTRGETSLAATTGSTLRAGSKVETTSGGAVRLRLQTGTQLWLEEHSALELLSTDTDQSLRLLAGRVHSEVVHLVSPQRFRIVTSDTEVEVRGTRFVVEWLEKPACAGQASTRVRVEEGIVWIRHAHEELELRAGGVWPPPCPAPAAAAVVVPAVAMPAAAPVAPVAPVAELGSRLAEENRRFSQVLQARQQGDTDGALVLLDALRRDFPHGHLEEDAAAEELRLVAGVDPVRARTAARNYLSRFPRGYARALAEELLTPVP